MLISGKPFWTWSPLHSGPRVWPQFWERLLQQTRIWEGLLSSRVWEGFLAPWLWPQLQLWPGCPVRLIRPGARLEVLLFGLQGTFAPLHKPLGVLLHVQGGEVQLKHKLYQRRSSSQVAPFLCLSLCSPIASLPGRATTTQHTEAPELETPESLTPAMDTRLRPMTAIALTRTPSPTSLTTSNIIWKQLFLNILFIYSPTIFVFYE